MKAESPAPATVMGEGGGVLLASWMAVIAPVGVLPKRANHRFDNGYGVNHFIGVDRSPIPVIMSLHDCRGEPPGKVDR